MRGEISNTTFTGANRDGTQVIEAPSTLRMVGWYCIGPVFYGSPSLRQRLAWRLLGLNVEVRKDNRFEGQPSRARPMQQGRGLKVVEGGRKE